MQRHTITLYKKATKDFKLAHVTPMKTSITAYGGTTLPAVGTVLVRIWCGDFRCRLDCKLVDSTNILLLLGRKACLGMKIVTYLDNDELTQPNTGDTALYTLNVSSPVNKDQLIKKHPKVFNEGIGRLEGMYHIRLDKTIDPVQHTPRRVATRYEIVSKKPWMA